MFEKANSSDSKGKVYVGAIAALMTGILVERFVFYAGRAIMYRDLADSDGGQFIYPSVFALGLVSVLLVALVAEFMVELRTLVILGPVMNGIGLFLLPSDQPGFRILGLALIAVGSAASKIGSFTYLGHVFGGNGQKIDGGYSLVWAAINLAAVGGVGFASMMVDVMEGTSILMLLGLLSIVQGLAFLILNYRSVLPAVSSIDGSPAKSLTASVFGGISLLMICIGFWIWILLNAFSMSGAFVEFTPRFAILIFMVVGFVLFATASGSEIPRRNGIFALILVMAMFCWAAVNASWYVTSTFASEASESSNLVEGIALAVFCTVIAVALLTRKQNHPLNAEYKGSGVRLLVGISICMASNQLLVFGPALGVSVLFIHAILFALGEALWGSLAMSMAWRLAPDNRKAIAVALFACTSGLGDWMAMLVEPPGNFTGESDTTFPIFGMLVFSTCSVFAALGVWRLLSGYLGRQSGAASNPFL